MIKIYTDIMTVVGRNENGGLFIM